MRHPDDALLSMLTTRYCIPQEWQIVLHQICSTTDPLDLRCESVTHQYGKAETFSVENFADWYIRSSQPIIL